MMKQVLILHYICVISLSVSAAALNGCNSISSLYDFQTSSTIIEVNQTVSYKCSVSDSNLYLQWYINGSYFSHAEPGIMSHGSDTNNTLIIQGLKEYNNTKVQCFISGFRQNVEVRCIINSTLIIQGLLDPVTSLSCENQECSRCVRCNWPPPFSLTPIPGYSVSVTNLSGELLANDTVDNVTYWNYCPDQFEVYFISVAGKNNAGIGGTANSVVNLTTTIEVFLFEAHPLKRDDSWNISINIKNATLNFVKISCIHINLTNSTGIIHLSSPVIVNESNFNIGLGQLQIKKKWQLSFGMQYNGLFINSSTTTTFSTFNVQSGSLSVENYTDSLVCFTCCLIDNSPSMGCYVHYQSLDIQSINGNVTINRIPPFTSNITRCLLGFYAGTYAVKFYDLNILTDSFNNHFDIAAFEMNISLATMLLYDNSSIDYDTVSLIQSPVPTLISPNTTIIKSSTTLMTYNSNINSTTQLLMSHSINSTDQGQHQIQLTSLVIGSVIGTIVLIGSLTILIMILIYILQRKYKKTNNDEHFYDTIQTTESSCHLEMKICSAYDFND